MGTRRSGLVWRIVGGLLAAGVLLVGGGVLWLLLLGWNDVRSDLVRTRGAQPELEAKGRALLDRAARAHGREAWQAHRTVELEATDRWASPGSGPWPRQTQRFRAERLLGTFTSRVTLLDGPAKGEVWGIQSWATYRVPAGGSDPVPVEDPSIEFYLPTLQYFDELPFRLSRATVVLYAGPGRYDGRDCERVFVTWETPEPHREHDQYDLWVDSGTGLIVAVRYTLRDAAAMAHPLMRLVMRAFAAGTMHFADYRQVDGVMVPFEQTVTLDPPAEAGRPRNGSYFHQIVVEEVRFDTLPPAVLTVVAGRPEPGDRKPGS